MNEHNTDQTLVPGTTVGIEASDSESSIVDSSDSSAIESVPRTADLPLEASNHVGSIVINASNDITVGNRNYNYGPVLIIQEPVTREHSNSGSERLAENLHRFCELYSMCSVNFCFSESNIVRHFR